MGDQHDAHAPSGDAPSRSAHSEQAPEAAFDAIAEALQRLRVDAGLPSYNAIVLRIARAREARGVAPEAARPARTTVYDAFRPGRRRLDPTLVGEIVRALGAEEDVARTWEERVRRARRDAGTPPPAVFDVPPQTALPDPQTSPAEAPARGASSPVVETAAPAPPRRPSGGFVAGVVAGSVAINFLGRALVDGLGLSVFLDMTGTAVSAIVLGPWWGALVGVLTNVTGSAISGPSSLLFIGVNVAGALVWGYGVRRFGLGRTLPRFLGLTLLVAATCTALAAPVILALGGETHHAGDAIIDQILATTEHLVVSVFAANLLISVVDKLISGFIGLAAAEALGRPVLGRPQEG